MGPEARGGHLTTPFVRLGQIVLTVAVTWFIVDRVGPGLDELAGVDPSAWVPDPLLLAAASILLLAAYFVSAGLWGWIVQDLGGPRLPLRDSIRIFMMANLGRYMPGKIWQIAGLAVLAKGRGVPAATSTAAAVLGQAIALVAASALGVGALLSGPEAYRPWGTAAAVLVTVAVALISVPGLFRSLAAQWFRLTRTESTPAADSLHGLRWLILYLVNWIAYALSFWILAQSLGLGGSVVPVSTPFAAAYVLGYLMVFAPAGLGPREGFLIVLLTPHLGAPASGVLAIVARLWTTAVELVPAAAFWLRHVASTAEGRSGSEGAG